MFEFDFEASELDFEVLEIKHLKTHNLCNRGVFFYHYSLATSTTNIELKFSQVCNLYVH